MQKLQFNENALAEIIPFENFSELAKITVPLIQKGTIALSGGSTFSRLFPFWVALNPNCSQASFFPVDERIVPFENLQSNWGIAFKNFLLPLGKESDKGNFAQSATQYQEVLKSKLPNKSDLFDVIFLGVGDDGHTASLFPGQSSLEDSTSLVLETISPKPPFPRVTLGMKPIISAKTVAVIISGNEKAGIVKKIFEKDLRLPIVKVLSQRKSSIVFVEDSILPC